MRSEQTHNQQTDPSVQELQRMLAQCARCERQRLRNRLRGLTRKGKPHPKAFNAVRESIERSIALRSARANAAPEIDYPEDLPVSARRDEIAAAIRDHQVVIVCGETGSGKTTQLPKICLELGRGVEGLIGHTQPRRLAARTVAARIADELNQPLGRSVGYKIRFGDRTTDATSVKLMTDGILLAETQGDRFLEQYDTIIVDEAHERSLNIDFLIGYLRNLLPKRPDLKVIITSATIDTERFARHFAQPDENGDFQPAPIIEVSGRTYPVEIRYRPLISASGDEADRSMLDAVVAACDEAYSIDNGDVLIFMPGEREIREAATAIRRHHAPNAPGTSVLPLYARLSNEEQNRVFKPGPGRRIVIATNVAETSVTVPRIRFVIDPGAARINRYSPRTKTQRLEIEPISKASADQRKGRCGRVGPGVCFRLYAEQDFSERPDFTDPEIRRTSLASVILQMASLNLGQIEEFPFLEPPERKQIRDGYDTLIELAAVDHEHNLTDCGRKLARLPIDPRIGRMLIEGDKLGCLREALVIASALSVQDPRDRPYDKRDAADMAHSRFADETSDFSSLLNLWKHYHEQKDRLSASKLRRACKDQFLSWVRLREWTDTHRQLRDLVTEQGAKLNKQDSDRDVVHRAVLSGLLSSIGKRTEDRDYEGPRSTRFSVHPGSGLFKTKADWIVAAELVRTTKLYARAVARVDAESIERAAEHLVRRTYANPRWSAKSQRVLADEKVTLWGLELSSGRPVGYGKVNPTEARELFIHHALVDGELRTNASFLRQNAQLTDEIRQIEAKTRRPEYLAEVTQRFRFFDERLPADIYDGRTFDKWWKTARDRQPDLLRMRRGDLLARTDEDVTPEAYPDELEVFGTKLELEYKLAPGEADDGVTVTVPLSTLAQLDEARMEWLTPGLLVRKVEEIVRTLPKNVRRSCGPADAFAREFAATAAFASGRLPDALALYLGQRTGERVDPEVFERAEAPEALRMRFRVVDDGGAEIGVGRDLAALRRDLRDELRTVLASLPAQGFNRDGLRGWEIDELPATVETELDGKTVVGYPALVDKGESVSLRLLETRAAAEDLSRFGLRRLYELTTRRELEAQVANLPGIERAQVRFATLGPANRLRSMLRDLIADQAFVAGRPMVRTAEEFEKRMDEGWNRLSEHAHDALRLTERILGEYQWLQETIPDKVPDGWGTTLADIRQQVGFLLRDGFLVNTPPEWLRYFPRYLAGARSRIEKLPRAGLDRDVAGMRALAPFWRAFVAKTQEHQEKGVRDPELAKLRWMLEEYRVSLFAQELKTAVSVSDKKLAKQVERVK